MKRTEYFATIEEANQYYPDGVPSGVIAIVGEGSQVLVSSDNAASNTQQYYNADLTNDEIVNTMVQDSYDEGHSDGYTEGVADGQAEGGANWLDILYLDEKAKAETALNVSTWAGNALKYNFANDTFNGGSCVNPQVAPALIAGVLQDSTIAKAIKISKDQNDNAVITYHPCYINFDGTNLGTFELDSNTYNTKMCLWSEPLTLAVDDEIIMDVAASISGDSMMLFGGYDSDAYEMVEEEGQTYKQWLPATFKCTTAGTYTFGITIDLPTAQDPQAIAFISTTFNYTGSATVPAIIIPTGEPASGITANDFLGQIVNNTITAGYGSFVISNHTPDSSVLTDAYQAASNGLGVIYKASGDTLSTLPLYNPYDEETGSQSELVYNDGTDEHSYYDWVASAPISLQVGDMLGFVVGSQYNVLWVAPFDGSEPFVCETAGSYTVLMTSYTDDETGDVVWELHIVPSTQLGGDYSNITDLNEMTMPISGN